MQKTVHDLEKNILKINYYLIWQHIGNIFHLTAYQQHFSRQMIGWIINPQGLFWNQTFRLYYHA